VPIFLGQTRCPYTPGRAADTQKCIRAGGKHNDLDDVGLDTYHHTFFEMLGNWSFGDYFKKDAIGWAWELVIEVWKFPPHRVYATIYQPDKAKNDPAERDQEAWDLWAERFRSVGLDPDIHIVNGGKKDNFWMMGETGPCGPCTEVHVDLRPGPRETDVETQRSGRALVNGSDARCIEIWNNVFIQYNANPDGTFTPLPAQHVDTGMGFERVTSIIQGTKGLTDFQNAKISNYETDIFRPIFDSIEKLSGKKYKSTLPTRPIVEDGKESFRAASEIEGIDISFRVIADHIRTVSFAIADGIEPGNKERNAVIRRVLRRGAMFGCNLGFHAPFMHQLVKVLAHTMGDVFPEIRAHQKRIEEVILREEEAFTSTLEQGLLLFNDLTNDSASQLLIQLTSPKSPGMGDFVELTNLNEMNRALLTALTPDCNSINKLRNKVPHLNKFPGRIQDKATIWERVSSERELTAEEVAKIKAIHGNSAFKLHDTYGFPIEETQRLASDIGFKVDLDGFNLLMEEQKARARAAQKKEVISLSQIETTAHTKFVGYDHLAVQAKVVEVVSLKDKTAVILDSSACYAEMGGQVGDTGEILQLPVGADVSRLELDGADLRPLLRVTNTQKSGNTWLHFVEGAALAVTGDTVVLRVDKLRRDAIQRHHTVTHLLHWALHEVVSREASQKGSFVGPDKLTFDFNSAALTPAQLADIEKLVNERIVENAGVSWTEVPYADVKSRKDVMQFFGDKYGDTVRVVQIGGQARQLDGYSMELCGGTHTRATGEIGLFRITGENAIAAGVRRIEAVAGLTAYDVMKHDRELIKSVAGRVNTPVHELDKKIESLLAHQKELEKALKAAAQKEAAGDAKALLARAETINGTPAIIANLAGADGDTLQTIADALKGQFKGVIVLGGAANGAVSLVAAVSPDFTAKVQAGKLIQAIAPLVGGKGGGKPDNARGGGKDAAKLDEALAKAKSLLG
jgi:alanyl-tRNA synthetase